jgi:hypothetical protein
MVKMANSLLISVSIMLLLSSCALTPIAVDPVGPAPTGSKPVALNWTGQGWLRVYTATDIVPDGKTAFFYPHTGYEVYTESGKLLEYVPNHVEATDESATLLQIHAGRYRVLAQSERYNAVSVPVVIQPGKITEVHLGCHWLAPSNASTNEIAYLPDGRPIGWKSMFAKTNH